MLPDPAELLEQILDALPPETASEDAASRAYQRAREILATALTEAECRGQRTAGEKVSKLAELCVDRTLRKGLIALGEALAEGARVRDPRH